MGTAWALAVLVSLLSSNGDLIFVLTIGAAILSAACIVFKPKLTLIALPYFALLSPVAGYINFSDYRLLLSDLLFFLLGVQCAFFIFKRFNRSSESHVLWLVALAVLCVASTIIGIAFGMLVSLKPILYLLQLLIVYSYTTVFAREEADRSLLINAWLTAGFLGAILLIQGFREGRILAGFKYGFEQQFLTKDDYGFDVLFRATYYYTGFHYVLGIAIVILFLRLLVCKSNLMRLTTAGLLSVYVLALTLMMNKTAMFSVLITMSAMLFMSFYFRKKQVLKVFAVLLLGLAIFSGAIFGGALQFLGENQADLWIQRLTGGSPARVEVYVQAVTSWFTYPSQIVIGMGPDFLDGSGDPFIARAFKYSAYTGVTEGTVDSGWLSYLIEMGVVAFALLVGVYVKSVMSVFNYIRQVAVEKLSESQALPVLGSLIFVGLALFTQMLGYTKLTWFPFQILLLAFMYEPQTARLKTPSRS
jgi:hypothetical protein